MTNFDRLLLTLISSFQGERTVSAVFHLLNGKRSGQTLQDVEYFDLKPYFSILPKLKKEWFDKYIENIVNTELIEIDQSVASLTTKGRERLGEAPIYHYNGWVYRGKEWEFFYRLSLLVQTLSHSVSKDMSFIPVQKDEKIQQYIKGYLMNKSYNDRQFIVDFQRELKQSISMSGMSENQKNILVHRLAGKGVNGWTWRQMADQLHHSEMDVYCTFIESLHIWLDFILPGQNYPLLQELAIDIRARSPLTESAEKTSQLFSQGHSMDDIARIRKLKMSTIEDHFVEMAINEPHFPITQFLTAAQLRQIKEVVKVFNTKKLRSIKEQLPELSYFQLRLGLAVRGGDEGGEASISSEREIRL